MVRLKHNLFLIIMLNMKNLEGIRIVNDNTVSISLLSGTISGSYLIPIESPNKLSVGHHGKILQYKIDNSEIILENDGVIDPALSGGVLDKVIGNSASIGINYFRIDLIWKLFLLSIYLIQI